MLGGVFLLLRALALFGFWLVAFEGERFGHVGRVVGDECEAMRSRGEACAEVSLECAYLNIIEIEKRRRTRSLSFHLPLRKHYRSTCVISKQVTVMQSQWP